MEILGSGPFQKATSSRADGEEYSAGLSGPAVLRGPIRLSRATLQTYGRRTYKEKKKVGEVESKESDVGLVFVVVVVRGRSRPKSAAFHRELRDPPAAPPLGPNYLHLELM